MAWSLKKEVKSLKESGFQHLPIGRNTFEITACGLVPVKDDPSGRKQQVGVTFTKGKTAYPQTFNTDHDNENIARMNGEIVRSLFEACGVTKFDATGLKKCVGKFVDVLVTSTEKNGKTYVNIKDIDPADVEEEEEEEEEKPAKKSKPAPEPEEEEEEEEEEEAPKPADKKIRPWG